MNSGSKTPGVPAGVVANPAGTGSIVTFTAPDGNSTAILYEIWRREGDSGGWRLLAETPATTFQDPELTPGQYYEYRIRALLNGAASAFSTSAVIYGPIPPTTKQ